MDASNELYQQVILEHNRKPKNFRKIDQATHFAEGYNPLCGDHLNIYLSVNKEGVVEDISFEGSGCAISKASASMMTESIKGKPVSEAEKLFDEFHKLVIKKLNPEKEENILGKLKIFSGIWQFPSRVKCASLAWHAMHGAINNVKVISTEHEE